MIILSFIYLLGYLNLHFILRSPKFFVVEILIDDNAVDFY